MLGGLSSVLVTHWGCRWPAARSLGINLKNVILKVKTGNCAVSQCSYHFSLRA